MESVRLTGADMTKLQPLVERILKLEVPEGTQAAHVAAAIALAAVTAGRAATMEKDSFMNLCWQLWDVYGVVKGSAVGPTTEQPIMPQLKNPPIMERELNVEDFQKAADIAAELGDEIQARYDKAKMDPWHVYLAVQMVAASFGKALRVVDGSHMRMTARVLALATDSMQKDAEKKARLN